MGHGTIRVATAADIPAMLRMGRDFVATGVDLPFDAAYAHAAIRAQLAASDRLALVLEWRGRARGMLCAGWMNSPLAPVKLAQELVFWIDPEARGRGAVALIRGYEGWARAQGCIQAALVARPGLDVGQIYDRLGYSLVETTWSKVL